MLKIVRLIFRIVRKIFRLSGLGKIKLGGTPLYVPIRRKLYRFIWKFAAPDLNKPVEIGGHKILGIGKKRSGTNGLGLIMDCYEEDSSFLFNKLIKDGDNVIDIGAHIGYYTLLAARKAGPSGRIYAFEPEIENLKWLNTNLKINGYDNVIPVNKAITDKSGPIKLWLGNSTGSHSVDENFHGHENHLENFQMTDSVSIDDFLEAEGWPKISVIKIDAEGAEPLVFIGMQELLKRQEDLKIIFEYNRKSLEASGYDPIQYFKTLQDNNFDLYFTDKGELNKLAANDLFDLCNVSDVNMNLLAIKQLHEN